MRLIFAPQAWEDYRNWQVNDRGILRRMNRRIDNVMILQVSYHYSK